MTVVKWSLIAVIVVVGLIGRVFTYSDSLAYGRVHISSAPGVCIYVYESSTGRTAAIAVVPTMHLRPITGC